jgi:hypothetical protein
MTEFQEPNAEKRYPGRVLLSPYLPAPSLVHRDRREDRAIFSPKNSARLELFRGDDR